MPADINKIDDLKLWEADCYDENSRLQQVIANNFLDILVQKFSIDKADALLLDIGCGTGRVSQFVLDRFPGIHLIGVDNSKEMIEYANDHFAGEKISFDVDHAEKLNCISTNSVDAITSFSCLHWVHNQRTAFYAMNRVLKPGGWIGLMFAVETDFDDPVDRAFAQAINEDPWKDYFQTSKSELNWNLTKPDQIKSQLEELRFQIDFVGVQFFDYPFKNFQAFQDWILGCFQQLKVLPADLQKTCARRIAELYLEATSQPLSTESTCFYRVEAFMVIAKKDI